MHRTLIIGAFVQTGGGLCRRLPMAITDPSWVFTIPTFEFARYRHGKAGVPESQLFSTIREFYLEGSAKLRQWQHSSKAAYDTRASF
jgi:hypothetical protein